MDQLINILKSTGCSLVVRTAQGQTFTYGGRGVSDLYRLLTTQPQVLRGATVADRVVGRGAAALMILGGVARLHTLLISQPAIGWLAGSQVQFTFDRQVPAIMNRQGNGPCPVERLTAQAGTPQEALPLIAAFVRNMQNKKQTPHE